jgi:hypothetical protein
VLDLPRKRFYQIRINRMIPYKTPDLCSRCGSTQVATVWKINASRAQFNLWTFITQWFAFIFSRDLPNPIPVPICRACEAQLIKIDKISRGVTVFLAILLGLIFGLVYWVRGVHGNNLLAAITIMILIILFGALFGVFDGIIFDMIIKEALNYEFCSFDGEYYQFKNRKFHRQFAALNPGLVKQKRM